MFTAVVLKYIDADQHSHVPLPLLLLPLLLLLLLPLCRRLNPDRENLLGSTIRRWRHVVATSVILTKNSASFSINPRLVDPGRVPAVSGGIFFFVFV